MLQFDELPGQDRALLRLSSNLKESISGTGCELVSFWMLDMAETLPTQSAIANLFSLVVSGYDGTHVVRERSNRSDFTREFGSDLRGALQAPQELRRALLVQV